MSYEVLLFGHILSVVMLLGIGGGSAFYKFVADRSNDVSIINHTNKVVVLVDWIFTTPAVLMQPITGYLLADMMGLTFSQSWLLYATILYVISTTLWFIAVYIQIQMKIVSQKAYTQKCRLDDVYGLYIKIWVGLGFASASAMLGIFVLMVFK